MEYRDLAPTNNIQNGQEYINALQWALENPKIKNIALASSYGICWMKEKQIEHIK